MSPMTTTQSLDDKVELAPTTGSNKVAGRAGTGKKYKKYNNNDVIMEALSLYVLPRGTSLKSFCNKDGRKVPLTTMRRLFLHCKVFEMQANNTCVGDVEKVMKAHLKKKEDNEKTRTGPANAATRYLTDNEELAIVQIARLNLLRAFKLYPTQELWVEYFREIRFTNTVAARK